MPRRPPDSEVGIYSSDGRPPAGRQKGRAQAGPLAAPPDWFGHVHTGARLCPRPSASRDLLSIARRYDTKLHRGALESRPEVVKNNGITGEGGRAEWASASAMLATPWASPICCSGSRLTWAEIKIAAQAGRGLRLIDLLAGIIGMGESRSLRPGGERAGGGGGGRSRPEPGRRD